MKKNKYHVIQLMLVIVFFSSCTPRLVLNAANPQSMKISFHSTPTDTTVQIIKGTTQNQAGTLEFCDSADLRQALQKYAIFPDTINCTPAGEITVNAHSKAKNPIFSDFFSQDKTKKRIHLNINASSFLDIVKLLPKETRDMLDLLMAPVLTGEKMSIKEYQENIAAFYGKTLADELVQSTVSLVIECPSPVIQTTTNINNIKTKATGKAAHISIPLTMILTLEEPIVCSIQYK